MQYLEHILLQGMKVLKIKADTVVVCLNVIDKSSEVIKNKTKLL